MLAHSAGPYERSLRERAIDARRRLGLEKRPVVRIPIPRSEPDPEPVQNVEICLREHDWLLVSSPELAPPVKAGQRYSVKQIIEQVATRYRVSFEQVVGRSHARQVTAARHEVFWRLHHELGMSFSAIGRKLDRDHSTILHGVAKHQDKRGE